jgi:hypothetical protein
MDELKDLDLEKLLELAKQNDKQAVQYDTMNDADKFIYYCSVKEGQDKVMAVIIYDAYVNWKGGKKNALPMHMFFRYFSKSFTSRRGWSGRYYMLDSTPFNNTKEAFLKARKKYARKKRKKARRNVQNTTQEIQENKIES